MFTDPVKNLKAFGLRESDIVADLGAGTGFYAVEAAKMVPQGKVYAIELHREYIETIKDKARTAKVKNLECLWADIEKVGGTKLGNGIVDAVIASNVLSQLEDKDKFLDEVKRILKPSGRVLLVDWSDSPTFGIAHFAARYADFDVAAPGQLGRVA